MNFTKRDRGAARDRRNETTVKELEAQARELEAKIFDNEQKLLSLKASGEISDISSLKSLTKDAPVTGGDPLHKDSLEGILKNFQKLEEEGRDKEIKMLEAEIQRDSDKLKEVQDKIDKIRQKEKQEKDPGNSDAAQPGGLSRSIGGSNSSHSV